MKPFLFACTPRAVAVLGGPQHSDFPPVLPVELCSVSRVQDSQQRQLLFFFPPLCRREQVIIEARDFILNFAQSKETMKENL